MIWGVVGFLVGLLVMYCLVDFLSGWMITIERHDG